jgi:hypothetical protein
MSVIDDAVRLGELYPVFPCRADKKPACKHGFKDAERTPAAVVDLWRAYPGPLIGLPTGEASGIDVLDIDPRAGGLDWLEEARDSLPITRVHHTRSGGLHFIFHHADGVRNSASKVAPGIDVRGTGGYIVAWPSHGYAVDNPDIIDDWPKWLLKILLPQPIKRQYPKAATKAEANTRAAIMISRAYDRVSNARPGERHAALRAAASTLGGLARFMNKTIDQVADDLVILIMQTGAVDRKNAEQTARWALEKGYISPLLTRD